MAKRIIPCLDVKDGRVVKGVHFVNLRDAGDPVENARLYNAEGADELVFLDITASPEGRATTVEMVRKVAVEVFMPFAVGGGVRTVEDVRTLLLASADKVSINTAAVRNPELLAAAAERFGSQCIIIAVDAKQIADDPLRPSTGSDSGVPNCPQCGSPLLKKLFSTPNVISRWGQPSGGGTCCGREERCAAPPCSTGETCRHDQ